MTKQPEIDLNLRTISEQAGIVSKILSRYPVFDPDEPYPALELVEEIVDAVCYPTSDPSFRIDIEYNNVRVYGEVSMQEVSSDGNIIHMSPSITHMEIVDYPYPLREIPYFEMTEAVQRELGLPLLSRANAPIEDDAL